MRYRLMATYLGIPYHVGLGPDGNVATLLSPGPPPDELGFTPEQLKLVRASKSPDYFHLNNMTPLGPNKWARAGDKRFDPDNILVDSRNANFIIIIDRKTGDNTITVTGGVRLSGKSP